MSKGYVLIRKILLQTLWECVGMPKKMSPSGCRWGIATNASGVVCSARALVIKIYPSWLVLL